MQTKSRMKLRTRLHWLERLGLRDNVQRRFHSTYIFVFDPKDLKREHYNYGSADLENKTWNDILGTCISKNKHGLSSLQMKKVNHKSGLKVNSSLEKFIQLLKESPFAGSGKRVLFMACLHLWRQPNSSLTHWKWSLKNLKEQSCSYCDEI